ncbi:GDP-mannose 4,6-dehydratase [bacterium]|nr:GDP-mannose 4,6-dehydratase [bacterium]
MGYEPDRKFWNHRKVFVTGCSGLLGSWLCERLINAGAEVIGLVRDIVPQSRFYSSGVAQKMVLVQGRLEDMSVLERALNEYEIDSVFHLGAQPIVGAANRNPLSTFEANIQGTWHLLEAVRRSNMVTRVVVASSDKAYGTQDVLPYTEEMSLQGRHPYDVSKSCTDLIAQTYAETYKLPVALTRCGNFYGGGDLNFNRIIPGTIRSALFNESPIIRSDGTYIRDYIYVLDVADAYLLLAEKMDDKSLHGEAFNFSNELQLTVLDLTQKILQAMKREDLAPTILNHATGEIKHQYLSAAKARRVLNWEPNYTIERSLYETIAWYREFFESRGLLAKA